MDSDGISWRGFLSRPRMSSLLQFGRHGPGLTDPAQTRTVQRRAHSHHLPRTTPWPGLPTPRRENTSRYQSGECIAIIVWQGQAGRLWCRSPIDEHQVATQHFRGNAILDGTGGHTAGWL